MDRHHHSRLEISPLLVGLLGVMAGAVIVATLHCIVVCWCRDTDQRPTRTTTTIPTPVRSHRENVVAADYQQQAGSSSSGSFSNVQLIITTNYTKEESNEDVCAVCLSEFKQGDEVRVLPECMHTFHVSCIDKWLLSHRNCPLCRAETLPSPTDLVYSQPHPHPHPDPGGGVRSAELYRVPDYPA
ncbi:hypothetical protein ACH5RR_004849 [Cinchona calisaya]|uniref:RING-type E3 ubiquitin transferase n=1 Tax=Cinchona calisaya TaxID=153742 RepID=A0ABD3AZD9_9GENT